MVKVGGGSPKIYGHIKSASRRHFLCTTVLEQQTLNFEQMEGCKQSRCEAEDTQGRHLLDEGEEQT